MLGSLEGNTESPSTTSSEHLLLSCSRQESWFPCVVWKGFPACIFLPGKLHEQGSKELGRTEEQLNMHNRAIAKGRGNAPGRGHCPDAQDWNCPPEWPPWHRGPTFEHFLWWELTTTIIWMQAFMLRWKISYLQAPSSEANHKFADKANSSQMS